MAKFEHPNEDTVKLINDVLLVVVEERHGINANILVDNNQKKVGVISKTNGITKFSYGDDLQITVNEIILERLPPVEQNMYIQEMLAGVWFDAENDKLVIKTPDVKTHHDFLEEHGYPKYVVMTETIASLYESKKQEDIEEKERLKASGNA